MFEELAESYQARPFVGKLAMRTSALVPVTAGHGRIGKEQDLVLPGGFARSVGGVGLGRGGVGGGATHGIVDLESWFSSGESQARNSWFSSGESQATVCQV